MNLEFNKIFAALLVAGIAASSASFVSEQIMHPHELEADAVPIEGVESVAGAISSGPDLPEPIMHLIATADVARGEKLSKACAACHSFDKGGANRIGPNLWGAAGNSKGVHAGFSYSDALLEKGGSWSYDSLNRFLYKPKDYISGTKMNYIGLKKPEDRAAMIAWLRTLSDSPMGLPSETQIAAERAELAPEPEEVAGEAATEGEEAATPDAAGDAEENTDQVSPEETEPSAGDEDISSEEDITSDENMIEPAEPAEESDVIAEPSPDEESTDEEVPSEEPETEEENTH
jgi:cytochrome c